MKYSRGRRQFTLGLCAAVLVTGCGELHRSAAIRYADVAIDVLISRGVCADRNSCNQRDMVKWEGGRPAILLWPSTGPYVTIYQVADAQLFDAVLNRIKEVQRAEELPSVTLQAYSGPHSSKGQKLQEFFVPSESR